MTQYQSDVYSKSILNPGYVFILTYSLYFLVMPLFFYIDTHLDLGFNMQNLVYQLYERKGIRFLTMESLYLILGGLISFVCGYFFIFKERVIKSTHFLNKRWPYRNILLGAILLFSAGTASKIYGVVNDAHLHFHFSGSLLGNNLIAFFSSLNPLHLASLSLLILGYFLSKGDGNAIWKSRFIKILLIVYPILFLASLNFGGRATTLSLVFSLVVIASYFSKGVKIQIKIVAALVFASFFLFFLKSAINNFSDCSSGKGPQDCSISKSISDYREKMASSIFGRVNMTHIFTEISLEGGDSSGESVGIFQQLVNKASGRGIKGSGNVFAREYGFVDQQDRNTGVGKTIIGGFYLSYGIYGVMFGLFFTGMLYRYLSRFVVSNVGLLVYSLLLIRMMFRIEMEIFNFLWDIAFYLTIIFILHIAIMEGGVIDRFFLRIRAWYGQKTI